MNDILKCDMCGADAGNDPYHATIDENGHVHICDGCFYPEHYDLGVLWRERERILAKLNASESRLHEVSVFCATIEQQHSQLLEALTRLEFAAQCRDNTLGDPCRLLEVKAELAEAAAQARAAIHLPSVYKIVLAGC